MGLFGTNERDAVPITVKDKQLRCNHCGNETFYTETVLLNFRGLTNERTTCFECAVCTQLQLFRGE